MTQILLDGKPLNEISESELQAILNKSQELAEKDDEQGAMPVTVCKNCVFADYQTDEVSGNKIQTGCFFGRPAKFASQDGQVLLVKEPDLDDEGKELETSTSFMVVNGRICTTLREQSWVDKIHAESEKAEDEGLTLDELKAQAVNETSLYNNTTLILTIPENTKWEKVENYVKHLMKFPRSFKHVIFMNASRDILPRQFLAYMQHMDKTPFTWQCEFILEGTHDIAIKSLHHQCVDIAVKKCKTAYYLVAEIDQQIEYQYLEMIDHCINVEMHRLLVVYSSKKLLKNWREHGLFSQVRLHKLVGGFQNRSYVDKVRDIAEKQESPGLVRHIFELFDNRTKE